MTSEIVISPVHLLGAATKTLHASADAIEVIWCGYEGGRQDVGPRIHAEA
jgi:hypothetical protein